MLFEEIGREKGVKDMGLVRAHELSWAIFLGDPSSLN